MTYLVLPTCSTTIFHVWTCEPFDEIDKSYLTVDYSLDCESDRYALLTTFAVIFALIFPLGIPVKLTAKRLPT